MKGSFISESVRFIEDFLEYADQENEDGILFAVDIEKVFDILLFVPNSKSLTLEAILHNG